VKKRHDFFVKITLVVFHLQHIIPTLSPYYLGGHGLTVHRIASAVIIAPFTDSCRNMACMTGISLVLSDTSCW
jgi:hypothetical protein